MRNGYFAFGGKVEMTTPTVFAFMYWKFSNKLVDHHEGEFWREGFSNKLESITTRASYRTEYLRD